MKIALGTILFFAAGLSPVLAAADDLTVNFEKTPLFSEANFLPGTVVDRDVEVTNNTDGSKQIITEAINQNDPDGFGDVLQIIITEGITQLFDGTLVDFLNAGEVALSPLGAHSSTTYTYSVSFASGVGNSYQEKSLGFDILVGFEGDQGNNENGNGGNSGGGGNGGGGNGGGGGSGGGGGESAPPGLTITGESVRAANVDETTATIEWDTSYTSTSRVVYDTASGVFSFSNLPNYGYSFSTTESDTPATPNGVLHHTVFISGLTQNTTYYFRTISHASPDTVSFEHSFTTETISPGNSFSESASNTPRAQSLSQAGVNPSQTGSTQTSETEHEIEQGQDVTTNSQEQTTARAQNFASLFTALPLSRKWAIFLVLIAAIVLAFIIWRRSKKA